MNFFLTLILILSSVSSRAQLTPRDEQSSNVISGNINSAPLMLRNIDLHGPVINYLTTHVHTLKLDSLAAGMQRGQRKNFIAGFSIEGAMVYQYQIDGDKLADWDDLSRNAGGQVLSFSIKVLQNGARQVSFTAIAFRNLNMYANSHHDDKGNELDLFDFLDRFDIISITWDQNYSLDNVKSVDIDFIGLNTKFGLVSDQPQKNKVRNFLALEAGGRIGVRFTHIDEVESFGYVNMNEFAGQGEYHGGIEVNLQSKKAARLNFHSNYVGGAGQISLDNRALDKANDEHGRQFFYRTYGYVKNSAEFSIPIKKSRRPMRLGVGADVNFILFDAATNRSENAGSADKIYFSDHYQQRVRGRVFFTF